MDRRRLVVLKKQEVPGYNSKKYTSARIFARAADQTKIPISLVWRPDLKRGGANPLFLTGYGAYGHSFDPVFSSNNLALLDRGFIYAIAHVRGGQELGRRWYDEGKLLQKKNTFTDFIACAERLIERKYTRPELLIAYSFSAGGLLIGAVLNTRPDLFKGAIAVVPFVDALNTMLDPTIPLTTHEYREWGDPRKKKYYQYIKSYSPYDNVRAQTYPHLLVTAGLNDSRVNYWEPAKWVAKLRSVKSDDNLLLLKTQMKAGHGGPSGRYEKFKEAAFEYAFILKILNPDSN